MLEMELDYEHDKKYLRVEEEQEGLELDTKEKEVQILGKHHIKGCSI